ncbi:hypothetical protein [Methanolobus psychrotolerans]|uniref:hypothetical protein n=1 Tax=Methanolobus psychrotolerans TaxID=1874706 RepID=UPI000B91AF13|nr:hypothetical protein [Methanolobus psychrotolerans]
MNFESNLPLNAGTLKEQFVYPKNTALKDSYVTLLGMMKLQKKIRFYVHECVFAILEQKGWITEHNPGDPDSKQDKNWKKAKNYLKVLENPYFRFVGPGVIELRAFDAATKRQVTNFDQFFKMCAEDIHMSEYTSCDEEVIFEPWDDVLACKELSKEDALLIIHDVEMMNLAMPLKKDILESKFESDYARQEYIEKIVENDSSSEGVEV